MSTQDLRPRQAPLPSPPSRRRPRWLLVLVLVLVGPPAVWLVLVLAVAVGRGMTHHPVPRFASLSAAPDPSLHGTVAYVDSSRGCVRLVSASGEHSRDLLCGVAPALDPVNKRKQLGPQLAWRPDGRLELTMFWMTGRPGWVPAWQRLVDPRTGRVSEVPASSLPPAPSTAGRATTSPQGERIGFTRGRGDGRVRITLTSADGRTRTLLDARGPAGYTYGLSSAFWSPTWDWVCADDGRVLVVTTGAQPVTRVLVPNVLDDPELPEVAVSAADLLG